MGTGLDLRAVDVSTTATTSNTTTANSGDHGTTSGESRETLLAVGVLERGVMVEEVMEEDVDAMAEDAVEAVEAVEAVVVVAEEKTSKD